jgi:hypothetical protein
VNTGKDIHDTVLRSGGGIQTLQEWCSQGVEWVDDIAPLWVVIGTVWV